MTFRIFSFDFRNFPRYYCCWQLSFGFGLSCKYCKLGQSHVQVYRHSVWSGTLHPWNGFSKAKSYVVFKFAVAEKVVAASFLQEEGVEKLVLKYGCTLWIRENIYSYLRLKIVVKNLVIIVLEYYFECENYLDLNIKALFYVANARYPFPSKVIKSNIFFKYFHPKKITFFRILYFKTILYWTIFISALKMPHIFKKIWRDKGLFCL